ncbi:MAG: universal stress protein [Bacteroidales bacterium]|nr:universal stress protein [Bacteroidales bacterium]
MKTKNKILVALDLEEQSVIALQYAEHFAEVLDYELEILTVIEDNSLFSKIFTSDEIIEKLNKEIKERVDIIIKPYINKVKINTIIAFGTPYEKIVEFAHKIQPAIIFMGKSELPNYKRPFIGSNSLHVILESDYPVITIRGDYNFDKYKKEHREILLPVDLKKDISDQITAAIEFAKLLKTSLRLFSIEKSGSKGKETRMLTQLAQTKKAIIDAGVECNAELIQNTEKDVYELICEKAEQIKPALIVIMTRQESKLADLFMGSNARDIINNSSVPVLSIEPWDNNEGSKVFSQYIDIFNVYKSKKK